MPNLPVSKAALTKNGQGYLSFPDQKSHDMAANNLKSAFAVESKDNSPKLLLLKIKISGLETDCYANNSNGLLQLKQTILRKNEAIQNLVESQMKKFDILFISLDKQRNESFAVAKVDPSIWQHLRNNVDKIFIDLLSHKVSDRIHLIQCYTYQLFSHIKKSSFCPL